MIYANHNFGLNFINAVGNNDDAMKSDIVIDEIARLIVDDKKNIIKMLRDEGVNVNYETDNLRLAHVLSQELKENKEFANEISRKIIKRNANSSEIIKHVKEKVKNKNAKLSADGKSFFNTLLENVKNDEELQSQLVDTASTIISSQFNKQDSESQSAGEKVLVDRVTVNEFKKNEKPKLYSFKKIALITGISIVIGVGIYFGIRYLKTKKMGYGGEIEIDEVEEV